MVRWRPCNVPGCPNLTQAAKCADCESEADLRRGTARQRGYDRNHERFRRRVLKRDRVCQRCREAPSTVADHYPLSRRELVRRGLDPNDPARGRGLCKPCHDSETAEHQPGGWYGSR